jgi:ASC-1-like (ASCH) protein
MNYNLDLNDRPFKAIRACTKKIETRVPTSYDKIPYSELKSGDTLTFRNNTTGEIMKVEIVDVRHYSDVRALLETEGTRNTLSSGLDINAAIERYNTAFEEYKENIPKYGIYGIEVRPTLDSKH